MYTKSERWYKAFDKRRKHTRNSELLADFMALNPDGTKKYNIVDLVSKYRITSTRIYQILDLTHQEPVTRIMAEAVNGMVDHIKNHDR